MITERNAPMEINKEEFIRTGYRLIDTIAEFFGSIKMINNYEKLIDVDYIRVSQSPPG